jgi:hypothetical protein
MEKTPIKCFAQPRAARHAPAGRPHQKCPAQTLQPSEPPTLRAAATRHQATPAVPAAVCVLLLLPILATSAHISVLYGRLSAVAVASSNLPPTLSSDLGAHAPGDITDVLLALTA